MQTIPKPLVLANQWTIVLSVLAALIFQNHWILIVPLVFGISQLAFGFHPIMKITKLFLSKPLNTYIQEDRDQQKFNQYIALTFLTIAIVSGIFHFTILSIISTIMVGLAAFIAIMGFCVGCFIRFQYQQWKYRRKNPSY
ncbi:DUF4395 domain-containing protein [Paenisporosarcina cavernae]|uniref:DUF4395 domain-containing protein n=1 Tax=Paenisporosarcina cavernae TaxID=2320858 RepID=A0A385YY17_9BACL|nr:DUF4395 domain-containing protein [Paenisporosarcina cavernae]AYC30827.1 DUF4395 domain-containing protein [Paenisporosarcina cavernae]